jgi:hypothetical protein
LSYLTITAYYTVSFTGLVSRLLTLAVDLNNGTSLI